VATLRAGRCIGRNGRRNRIENNACRKLGSWNGVSAPQTPQLQPGLKLVRSSFEAGRLRSIRAISGRLTFRAKQKILVSTRCNRVFVSGQAAVSLPRNLQNAFGDCESSSGSSGVCFGLPKSVLTVSTPRLWAPRPQHFRQVFAKSLPVFWLVFWLVLSSGYIRSGPSVWALPFGPSCAGSRSFCLFDRPSLTDRRVRDGRAV